MIPIARPAIGEEETEAVRRVLESGQLVQGPQVASFERRFARYVGRDHGVAVSSGTAALQLALTALGVREGNEVVVPPITFFASASTVALCGGRPRFADVDAETYTMDPASVPEVVGPKTKALMPVDIFGQVAAMDLLLELAAERGLALVEDACQAHGATYKGRQAGSFGDASCFSFYATKNMTTGEGGMILTDDADLAETCRLLRDHGQIRKYEHVRLGYNLRMTEMAAAIGLVQLRRLDDMVARRRENARRLTEAFRDLPGLVPPGEAPEGRHSFYQYVVRLRGDFPLDRDDVVARLAEMGIGARPSYPRPVYAQEALRGQVPDRCPRAEALLPQLFELPVHALLTQEDLESVVAALRAVVRSAHGGESHAR